MVYDWFCLIILGLLWIVANVCQCSSHPFSIHENYRGTSWNISGQRPAVPEESMGRNVFEIEVRTAGRPSIFKTSGVPGVFLNVRWERFIFQSLFATMRTIQHCSHLSPGFHHQTGSEKKKPAVDRQALLGVSGVALGTVVAASGRHTWRSWECSQTTACVPSFWPRATEFWATTRLQAFWCKCRSTNPQILGIPMVLTYIRLFYASCEAWVHN